MTPTHALTVAAAIVGGLFLIALIAWEIYRHRDEIRDLGRRVATSDRFETHVRWIDRNAMGTAFDDGREL